jgi:aconitase B
MKIVAFIMCFLFPLTALADEGKLASIKESQKAPFTGFLFDPTAFAKIEADKQFLIEKCTAEKKLLADKCDADKKFLNDSCAIEKDKILKSDQIIIKGKDDEITRLNKLIEDMHPPSKGLWFGLGAAAGVAISLTTVYLVKKL